MPAAQIWPDFIMASMLPWPKATKSSAVFIAFSMPSFTWAWVFSNPTAACAMPSFRAATVCSIPFVPVSLVNTAAGAPSASMAVSSVLLFIAISRPPQPRPPARPGRDGPFSLAADSFCCIAAQARYRSPASRHQENFCALHNVAAFPRGAGVRSIGR